MVVVRRFLQLHTNFNSKKICKSPICFIAFGFGSGFSGFAPGTFGTLVAFPIYFLMRDFFQQNYILPAITLFFIVGIYICHIAGKCSGACDHSGIVWDEIVAMLLILQLTPDTPSYYLADFLLFRLFDIVKPWPIRFFDQKLKNGFGVMFDDLLAAGFALGVIAVYQSIT